MSTSTGRSRVLLVLGLLLIVTGVGILGWFGWQYWGTNIVAQREHDRIRAEIRQQWRSDDPETKIEGVGLLRVPRFGEDFEVPILDGDDPATLARGVGRDTDGAEPGEIGNLVLSGHRVTHGEPFRDFLSLRAGDEVIVETRTHVHTYVLRQDGDRIRVPFTTTWPLWPVPDPDAAGQEPTEAVVTLVTCAELFRTDDRNVVIGDLESSVEK